MIVVAAGLVRSGGLALYQLMREIVEFNEVGDAPIFKLGFEREDLIERLPELATDTKWHVIKLSKYLPELDPYQISAVIMHRDPRAVILSLMHFRNLVFQEAIAHRYIQRYQANYYTWHNKIAPAFRLTFNYDWIMYSRVQLTTFIAEDLLDLKLHPAQASAIEAKWNIRANKTRAMLNLLPTSPDYIPNRLIYSGSDDRWREELTDEQIWEVEEYFANYMHDARYEFYKVAEESDV